MRVALVCPYSLSRPGGVQGQVQGLARALGATGHAVLVLSPDDDRPPGWVPGSVPPVPPGSPVPPGPPGPPVPAGQATVPRRFAAGPSTGVRANGSVAPVSLDPRAAWRARRAVRAFGADVVHFHEPLAPVVGYWCLAEHRLPAVGTYHRSGEGRGYRLAAPLVRWADARLDVRCAVSEAAAATLAAVAGHRPVEVLFNGVEVDRFAGAVPTPAGRPAVLFLGRHERRKGLDVLLEAFRQATWPAGAAPVLWVAGDGPETGQLRRRYEGHPGIEWLGVLDDAEVPARLAGASVLCAPSLAGESFGMVLLEAMAAGCAVVASDIPGYRAAAGGHAALVPPGDAAALARALAGAVGEVTAPAGAAGSAAMSPGGPARLAAARLAAARRHAEGWSMGRLATRYVALYERARVARPGA